MDMFAYYNSDMQRKMCYIIWFKANLCFTSPYTLFSWKNE